MSRKLISDLSRLLRVMFVTCLIFSNFCAKSRRNIVFVFLRFVLKFHLKLACTLKCLFFPNFSIQYFVLDPKIFRLPCCRSAVANFFGTKLVE